MSYVADGAHPPIDKACGEGLMPDSFAALHRLGIRIDAEQSFRSAASVFWARACRWRRIFPVVPASRCGGTCLHQALIDRAHEAGVTLLWGSRVNGLTGRRRGAGRAPHPLPLGDWGGWAELTGPALGRVEWRASRIVPLRIPAALSHCALDRLHGDLLGLRFADVRDSCKPMGSLRGFHHARSHICGWSSVAAVSGSEPEACGRGRYHHGTGRGYRVARFTASVSRRHYFDRRCFRIGGCDHRRRPVAFVSPSYCARRTRWPRAILLLIRRSTGD